MRNRRHKLWIDRFQTSLSIRIGLYFVFFEVIIGLTFTVGRAIILDFQEVLGVEAWGFLGLIALSTLALMAGLFIRDAIAYTHRIVGPLYRFRKAIQAIIAGDELELIRLRKGDHLQEFKDEFNQMLQILEQRGAIQLKTSEAAEPAPSPEV